MHLRNFMTNCPSAIKDAVRPPTSQRQPTQELSVPSATLAVPAPGDASAKQRRPFAIWKAAKRKRNHVRRRIGALVEHRLMFRRRSPCSRPPVRPVANRLLLYHETHRKIKRLHELSSFFFRFLGIEIFIRFLCTLHQLSNINPLHTAVSSIIIELFPKGGGFFC